MLRKVLATLGLASASVATGASSYSPYSLDAANAIYNLLFCDDVAAYIAKPGEKPTPWQAALASSPSDIKALQTIAADRSEEGRIRFLAYQRLRQAGQSVPGKELLGVIVEVPLDGGLDTLAAYSEGGVRYINQSGKIAVFEGVASMKLLVDGLFAASQPVVDKIGPWKDARRAPPARGNIRLTFLVSDGLYFGEGPFNVMQREQMAAPVIHRATELLQAVVAMGTE